MSAQLSKDVKALMEQMTQITQSLMEKNWGTNKLLQIIENTNKTNPRPKNVRDINSNHSENNHNSPTSFFALQENQEGRGEEANEDSNDNVEIILETYSQLDLELRNNVPFKDYYNTKMKYIFNCKRKTPCNQDLEKKINKVVLPNFGGKKKFHVQTWSKKLDTYLQHSPMMEGNSIKFFILHLTRITHGWWQYGEKNHGYQIIIVNNEFTQKLIRRFDQKDP